MRRPAVRDEQMLGATAAERYMNRDVHSDREVNERTGPRIETCGTNESVVKAQELHGGKRVRLVADAHAPQVGATLHVQNVPLDKEVIERARSGVPDEIAHFVLGLTPEA